MGEFRYKKRKELKKMSLEEVRKYFRDLRKYEFDNNIPIRNLFIRDIIHPVFLLGIKLDRVFSGRKLEIINDYRINTNKPHIFACTHVGRYDIETSLEAAKKHAYIFWGDRDETYLNNESYLIDINGTISFDTGFKLDENGRAFFDEDCKEDRKIAYKRNCELLKRGQNSIIFVEGAWNLEPNKLVQNLYPGVIDMCLNTSADIIPMAIERYGKKYIVNIGRNIDFKNMDDIDINHNYMGDIFGIINNIDKNSGIDNQNLDRKSRMLRYLRDAIATLVWEIVETEKLERSKLDSEAYRDYVLDIMSESENNYTEEIIRASIRKDDMSSPDEVFSHIRKLSKWKDLPKSV